MLTSPRSLLHTWLVSAALCGLCACADGAPGEADEVTIITLEPEDAGDDLARAMPDMKGRDASFLADMGDLSIEDLDQGLATRDPDEDDILAAQDNCPEVYNPDQADRDRDGMGDACDHFSFYHDVDNPEALSVVDEAESVGASDSPVASEVLGLTLPFAVSGVVNPPERGEPDLDFFGFEVDRPGVLLLEIEPEHTSLLERAQFFPAAIVAGYGLNNANVFRVGFAKSQSNPLRREVFLPLPGRYTIITSELANFGDSPPSGSPLWRYTLRASVAPLPAPTSTIAPDAPLVPHTTDGSLRVHEMRLGAFELGLRASLAKRRGADERHRRPHLPALAIVDPDTLDVLAYSGEEALSRQEARARLELKLAGARERLWLIEDYIQRDEREQLQITPQVEHIDLSRELETAQMPRDVRHRPLTWLEVGASIQGHIDEPDEYGQDQDLYLFRAHEGRALRLTVTPAPGARLTPSVKLGHAYAEYEQTAFFVLHRSETPAHFDAEARSVSYLISDAQAGEMGVLIGHARPRQEPGGELEGGPAYGYELSLEEVDPVVRHASALPSEHEVYLEAGGYGALSFEAEQGQVFLIEFSPHLGHVETRLLDEGFDVMERTFADPITFKAPASGRYIIDVTSLSGAPSPAGEPERVRIEPVDVLEMGDLPMARGQGELDAPDDEQHWRVKVPADTLVELGFGARGFLPEIQVFEEGETLELLGITSSNELVSFEQETTLLIKVTAREMRGATGLLDYTIGARAVTPTAPWQAFPTSATVSLPEPPFGAVVPLDLKANALYSIQADGAMGEPLVQRLIDRASLGTFTVAEPGERLRWIPNAAHEPMLFVHHAEQAHITSSSVALSVGLPTIEAIPEAQLPRTAVYDALTDETIYRIELAEIGALTLRSSSPIAHRVTWLGEDDLRPLPVPHLLDMSSALSSELTHYYLAVHPTDTPSHPQPITISTDYRPASSALPESEPNDALAQATAVPGFPALYEGSLSSTHDREDGYTLELAQGDLLWAMMAAGPETSSYALDAELVLTDSEGATVAFTRHGAEGFFPALRAVQIDRAGTYHLALRLPPEVRHSMGNYILFIEREPAP